MENDIKLSDYDKFVVLFFRRERFDLSPFVPTRTWYS